MSNDRGVNDLFNELLAEVDRYMPPADKEKFVYGSFGRLLSSLLPQYGLNDPFYRLSLRVAGFVAEIGMQGVYLASAMLYFPFLDQRITESQIHTLYGKDGKFIVANLRSLSSLGVIFEDYLPWIKSKILAEKDPKGQLSDFEMKGDDDRKRNRSKFWDEQKTRVDTTAFLAISREPEIAFIKLLERLYLLKDLGTFPLDEDLYLVIAQNTLDVFSQAAEAIGAWSIKSQLEDLAFKLIQPEEYKAIAVDLQERLQERQARIDRAIEAIREAMLEEGIAAKVTGRPKHLYGIYLKLQISKQPISAINDNLGTRIIVNTKEECYLAFNILERKFQIAENIYEDGKKYRDWIAQPKRNKYQSIHTTIVFENRLLEVQIRTQVMHDMAEYGEAAHWVYRKAGNDIEQQKKYQEYIKQIADFRRAHEKNQ